MLILIKGRRLLSASYQVYDHVSQLSTSTSEPKMPSFDHQLHSYKGYSYEESMAIHRRNINPSIIPYYKHPLLLIEGKKQWLYDIDGKRYLDMFGGIVTVGVGHCHPDVTKAVTEQLNKLWHTSAVYMNPSIYQYAQKLAKKMPENLRVFYFVNSGSEAVDLAVTLARLHTKRYDIIALRNGYHGLTSTVMGLVGVSLYKHAIPQGFGIYHAMNPDVYRGIWGGSNCRDSPVQTTRSCDCKTGECQSSDKYVQQLEEVLQCCTHKAGVAAFICESIQGVGGTVQYPKSYLKNAYELIRSSGGVCIADEVQSGFGRTGDHFWGFEGHGVIPDIVVMAKSIGNGFPLAAVATSIEISKALTGAIYFNTFGGNPLACAAGSAVLDVIEKEKYQENSLSVGTYLLKQLEKLRDKFEVVGDVRGKGLMIGVELVSNKKTQSPLEVSSVEEIKEDLKSMGVLIGSGGLFKNIFRIKPPMCINKEDADFFISVFDRALHKYTDKIK